jgi:tRNA1(Val) A37 N6-methylase TrmN6
MSETIIVSLITGGITLIGVLMSNNKHQAVIDTKIEELTREVREHNNFAKRMPVVENDIKHITEELKQLAAYHK